MRKESVSLQRFDIQPDVAHVLAINPIYRLLPGAEYLPALAGPFPPSWMKYTTYFRVTVDAENDLAARRKAAQLVKEEPLIFASGTYEGTGKKPNKGIIHGFLFGMK